MKPHEEEWTYANGKVMGPDPRSSDGAIVCDVLDEPAGPLLAAAPDMARALIAFEKMDHGDYNCAGCATYDTEYLEDENTEVRTNHAEDCWLNLALIKAGITPEMRAAVRNEEHETARKKAGIR